jgi:hypothetical protein
MVVTGTYNLYLVALSILVAAFASYTALDFGGRVAATRTVAPRVWLVAAAIAMGGGIWSMHFIAMLAFNMPVPMSYDVGLTTLSLIVAIFVTGVPGGTYRGVAPRSFDAKTGQWSIWWIRPSSAFDLIGSAGMIRNYNHRNFHEIFFDHRRQSFPPRVRATGYSP